jgi:hypothetical protein
MRTASRSCFARGTRISPTTTVPLQCAESESLAIRVLADFLQTIGANQKS